MENRWEKQWEKRQILFSWAPKSLWMVTAAMKLKHACPLGYCGWTNDKTNDTMKQQMETVTDFICLGSKITADGDCSHEIKRHLLLGRKARTNLDSLLKSRDHFADKGPYSQSYGLSSSHVQMWELDHKESWVPKNWCFQILPSATWETQSTIY